jgi:hypothetical protein
MYRLIGRKQLPVICLGIIVLGTAFYPGDTPWLLDEPLLMNGAIVYNARPSQIGPITFPFTLAVTGLEGTRGVRYGPLAAWIDQLLLMFTSNPVIMVAIRALIFSGVTATALFWLCKTLKFSPWLAVVVMSSPWLWFYSRQLWDNSLCIPFCAMLIACYADFLTNRRTASLLGAAFCAMALLLLHFMALAIIAAFVLHLVIFERRAMWRPKWPLLAIVVGIFVLSSQYWLFLLHDFHREIPADASGTQGWLYPLLGAHHLSAAGLGNIFGTDWKSNSLLIVAQRVTLIAYPLVWIGMLLAVPRIRWWQNLTPLDHILLICVITLILQSAIDGIQRIPDGPQYYNATWIIFALFAFLAVKRIPQPFAAAAGVIFAGSTSFIIISLAVTIHKNTGTRAENFGTVLSNQFEVATQIQNAGDALPEIDFPQWQLYPVGLQALEKLSPVYRGSREYVHVRVKFRDAFPGDAAIEVIPVSPRSPESPP